MARIKYIRESVFFLVASFALLLGCHDGCRRATQEGQPVPKTEHLGVETEARSVGSETDPSVASELFWNWFVVGSSCPGICAMSSEEADSWIGLSATLSESGVVFGDYICRDAKYERRRITRLDFFRSFRFNLEELGILKEDVEEWAVACDGQEWIAPGSLFFVKDRETLIAPWNGVYFELKRTRPTAD